LQEPEVASVDIVVRLKHQQVLSFKTTHV